MKNIVGQTPRGDNFFKRNAIVDTLYRRLEAGNNLFLAAPRRVGKTSILRFMEDAPRAGYHFVYVITESVDSIEGYYKRLLEVLLKNKVMGELTKISAPSRTLLKGVLDRIQRISIPDAHAELDEKVETSYQGEFENLLASLDTGTLRIIIMVDEFPQTLENIREAEGLEAARKFLKINRSQRQQANANIRFVLTGSIGLPILVRKVDSLQVINDLNVIELPPLSQKEARDMTFKLLKTYKIPMKHRSVVDYLLGKIKWLIPFHIQLTVQEIIDVYETDNKPISKVSVDRAFLQITHFRNDVYFESYYARLHKAFNKKEYPFAQELLDQMATHGQPKPSFISDLARKHDLAEEYDRILDSLEYDGYIVIDSETGRYRFNSPILKLWWGKYAKT